MSKEDSDCYILYNLERASMSTNECIRRELERDHMTLEEKIRNEDENKKLFQQKKRVFNEKKPE